MKGALLIFVMVVSLQRSAGAEESCWEQHSLCIGYCDKLKSLCAQRCDDR
jgi:hypothetical protein